MTEPNLYGYLTLLKNDTLIHKYTLAPKKWTIGGGLSNNIRFLTDDDRLLSTQCVIIVQDNGVAILKNKKAMVPITVNKKKINASKVLEPGDILEISTKQFLYGNDVLTKKKIKELSRNIKQGCILKFPSVSKRSRNWKTSSKKLEAANLSNKNMEFNSEKVTPDKLLPTKKSQSISTSFSKTPMPDKLCAKPSTRLSVSTGKIYKSKKPVTKLNKNENFSSHIPVLNKNPISLNATSSRIRKKIWLEDVFDNTEPAKGKDKKQSIIKISSTESTPLERTNKPVQSTPQYSLRKRSSFQNIDSFIDNSVNDSSFQLNSSSVSNRNTSMQKIIKKNSVNKVTKIPESSFKVSYVLDTPVPSGTQKLSKSFVFSPAIKTSRRVSRRCTTGIKNRSCKKNENANKSINLPTRSIKLKSSLNKKLFSRSETVENLTEIKSECISNKEDEVNPELRKSPSKKCKRSKRYTNNQINENNIKILEDAVKPSSTNISKISIKAQVNDDEEILAESFGKELNSSITHENESMGIRRSSELSKKHSEQSNSFNDIKKESFEQKIDTLTTGRRSARYNIKETNNISENTSVSDYFEQGSYEEDISTNFNVNTSSSSDQGNSKTGRRQDNYDKEDFLPEENLENTNQVLIRRSNKQAVEELEKSNSFHDHNQQNIKSGENIKTRYSLKNARDYVGVLDSSNRLNLMKNISLNESALKISRKSGKRNSDPLIFNRSEEKLKQISNISLCLRRSNDYNRNQSNNDANKLNISEEITQKSPNAVRVSSMIKFSPITPGIRQKSRASKTPTPTESKSNSCNTSVKIPYNKIEDESLFSTSTDKENTSATEVTKELHSPEEVYRTPDSIVKIPKQIPKTPKSNVKSRKSVFLQDFEHNKFNPDNLGGNETNNDTTIVESNNMSQTPKTPKSNRKVRISDNIPIGQPSIVKDLRKSIASPECNFKNKSSENECFQYSDHISSKSLASINDSFMQETEKTPYSRTKRSSSLAQLSPKSNIKASIRSNPANVSTPKSNIKIRHSVTFEITTDDLQSLAQSSLRESNGAVNQNKVSKPKERSLIAYTEIGSVKQLPSKKRQRSSIHICLPEKRQKIDDEYLGVENDYNQQMLQDISNDSSFDNCIDTDGKTPTLIGSKTYAAQKRGFTDSKENIEKCKRRSLPSEVLFSQENKSHDYTNDNEYSFISSTDTSSILFEYHPATNINNLLVNNITFKPEALNISGVVTLTPKKEKFISTRNSSSNTKMPKSKDGCNEISAITKNCKIPENESEKGHNELGKTNIVSRITKNQKEPVSSYVDRKLFKSSKQQREPACSYEDVRGVKKLLTTPKQQREPACSYEDVRGVKKLLTTPKQQKEPACSYEDVRGVKKLLKTPKQQKEPACSYEDVQGVKKLLTIPKQQREPLCSYEDVRGVKKLLTTPKQQKEPACSYEDVRGLKKLLKTPKQQKEPACSYEDVRGVKKLLTTPKQQKEPACSYEDVRGVKNIFKTSREQNEPLNSYENIEGVKNLFKTPKLQTEPPNSYENVEGIDELFKTPLLVGSRRIRKNTEDDNILMSQEQKIKSLNKIKNISNTPSKSLSESEDAEKDVMSLRRTRRQIKTKQCESSEMIAEDDKILPKEIRILRKKNVETSAGLNTENKIESTETSTKNTNRNTEVTETKHTNEDSRVFSNDVLKRTVRTRRAKNVETDIADITAHEEEIQRSNRRAQKGIKKEEILNEKPKRATRKQIKNEEIKDKRETSNKQSKKASDVTVEKDIEKIKEENISFESDNSESHKNVITNLIQSNRFKRRKAHLYEEENSQLNDVNIETPAIKNEISDSVRRRQPKRKKTETSEIAHNSFEDIKLESDVNSNNDENMGALQRKQSKRRKATNIAHNSFEDIKHESDVNSNNDENMGALQRKQSKRKKATNLNEIEYDTLESIKDEIDTSDDKNEAAVRRKRPRRKNNDVCQAETEMHLDYVEVGRSLRTRRQKKAATIDIDKTEEYKKSVDSLSAKKTKVAVILEEEQQARKSNRTPKTRKVSPGNSGNVNNSPITVRETRKKTRRILSKDEIEAASEIMPEIERKTRRAKATVKVDDEITPIRKSTRQRR